MKESKLARSWIAEHSDAAAKVESTELESLEGALSRHAASARGTVEAALVLFGIAFSLGLGLMSIAVSVVKDDLQALASALWISYGWLIVLLVVPGCMLGFGTARELRALRGLRELAILKGRRERQVRELERTRSGRRELERLRRR